MTVSIALFDLGRVVLDWQPAYLYDKIFDRPEDRDHFLGSVCTMAWHMRHDAGATFAENAAPLIAEHPGFESPIRAWGGRWMEMFHGYIPGTAALIERLDAAGVPLYALSNMPADPWAEMLAHFTILQRFRDVVVSGEINMIKPDPAIFRYTLERIGNPAPESVLFIDDSAANIAAAAALGFATHHFTDATGLEASLSACGLI
ncbi:HAD-IA family hydrolase [Hyphomonas johnsonii]|uniref:HAD family hydrolase n=1 Tax=Hyphomonas johnsonii MHS-2 TaxID=1280950 RepID=A0A059FM40_9PROT|nr:HAD-IA family hydrolase [Hyphomonas johnsonii]KCZ91677.1 HAD family hydrolase [Hyphomonas johnsonii MHS-2]